MSKEPGPHVVARSSNGSGTQSDDVRPTSSGLVGRTGEPMRAKRPTDLDVSFEVVSSPEQLAPAQPRARGGRVVQTVPRSSIKRAPESVQASGSAPLPIAPIVVGDPDDPFADMFADAPAAVAPVHTEAPEPAQHFELEANEPDAPAFRFSQPLDAAPISAPYVVPRSAPALPPTAPIDLAIHVAPVGSVVAPAATSEVSRVDVPIAAVAATIDDPRSSRPPGREPESPGNVASFVRQVALGIVIGCVGLGVYLGIAASI